MPVLSCTLILLLFVAVTYTSVAPQDADSFCLNLPSRPETNPRQVILLDTANYRAQDLVTILGQSRMWISLKHLPGLSNLKWGDHIQGGSCNHNLLTCYFNNGAQNNWLITQYINISTTEVTDLNVSATFATSTMPCIAGECLQNVPVRVYWTNTPNEIERNTTSNYNTVATRLLHTTNDGQRESDHEDVEVPSNITGLYLALVDEGTCVSITRLVVSYNVCPEQTQNLIVYPQTIAPTARIISFKMVPASCVDGASMAGTTTLVCTVGGLWGDPPADTCQCDPGYQMIGVGLNATCEACPPQQFKSGRSNTEACRSCPQNSYANANGSDVCICSAGYDRTCSETSDAPCTVTNGSCPVSSPTPSPSSLPTTNPTSGVPTVKACIAGNSVTVEWTPPTGGDSSCVTVYSYSVVIFNNIGVQLVTLMIEGHTTSVSVGVANSDYYNITLTANTNCGTSTEISAVASSACTTAPIGLGVGIPVTFLLSTIISSLLTLLITYLCMTRGGSCKFTSPVQEPVYDPLSSGTSVEMKSNMAYGQVTTVSSDTGVEMKSNAAYGQVTTVSSGTSVEMKSNVAYGQVTTGGHVTYETVPQVNETQ